MSDIQKRNSNQNRTNSLDGDNRLHTWLLAGPFDRNAIDAAAQGMPSWVLDALRKLSDAELVEARPISKQHRLDRSAVRPIDPELADRLDRLDIGIDGTELATSRAGFDEATLRPSDGDTLSSSAVTSGQVEWFPYTADCEGRVDLISAFWQYDATPRNNVAGKPDHSLAYSASLAGYAATYIDSPREQTVRLDLTWSGEGAVILNGKPLEQRVTSAYETKASWDLPLRQGENILLIRLSGPFEGGPWDARWGWSFTASFGDADDCVFNIPVAGNPAALSADLCATPFFVRGTEAEGEDNLKRVFHLVLRHYGEKAAGRAIVKTGGESVTLDLGEVNFGLHRFEIALPSLDAKALVEAEVQVGDATVSIAKEFEPGRRYTIYIVESSHLDIAFTDPQDHVSDTQVQICDECLRFIDEEKDPDFHFTIEGMWTLFEFMQARSPEKIERLMELVREGRIELGALNSTLTAWGTGDEELCREFMRARALSDRYGVAFKSALFVDVPGIGWGLAEGLHRAGVRYVMSGMNESFNGRSFAKALPREFWWETPSGGRLLVCAHRGYYAPAELHPNMPIQGKMHVLARHILEKETDGEPGDHVIFFGSNYDNTLPTLYFSRAARDWNSRYAYPKIVLTTASQAFEQVEKNVGQDLPVLRGDWAGYWDGNHHEAWRDCRVREQLVLTEKLLNTLALQFHDVSGLPEVVRQAYELLIDAKAHGANGTAFGIDSEIRQARRWHDARMALAESLAEGLMTRATRLAGHRWACGTTHIVYNSSSWTRDGIVEFESRAPIALSTEGGLGMRDLATGEVTPLQVRPIKSHTFLRGNREGASGRFLAKRIPAMGYKVFEVVPCNECKPSPLACGDNFIENEFYRIEVDVESGRIGRVVSKTSQRELVNPNSQHHFAATRTIEPYRHWLRPTPQTSEAKPAVEVSAQVIDESPVRVMIVVEQKGSVNIRSEVMLYPEIDAILLRDSFTDAPGSPDGPHSHHGLVKNFPIAMASPQATLKVSNTFITPGVDQLPGAGDRGTYIPQYSGELNNGTWGLTWAAFGVMNVRLEGLSMDQLRTPPLPENPNLQFALHLPAASSRPQHAEPISVLYALRAHEGGVDQASTARFGMELAQPLLHISALGSAAREMEPCQPFITVDSPSVVIQALKRSENGEHLVLRLHEVAGVDTTVTLRSPFFRGANAWYCDLLEKPGETICVEEERIAVAMPRNSIISVAFAPKAPVAGD